MDSMKKTYYVDLVAGDVIQAPGTEENPSFKIQATDEEVRRLQSYLSENYSSDLETYFRAHVPYVEYHKDPADEHYDKTIIKLYSMIYELGDAEARRHIESMGILDTKDDTNRITENFKQNL
ncbi:hydrolase [Peribacillus sp. SCS-155]|uniref:hydrolase n=1 Tax=Peribacillus sedimenti TaxID=3115297 RepID=UPI003905CA77